MTKTPHLNQNDVSAAIYDIVYDQIKDEIVTTAEIELVKSLLKEPSTNNKILDLGCGTARHIKPLLNLGFQVAGLDTSLGMLTEAAKKIGLADGQITRFYHHDDPQNCQLICNTLENSKIPNHEFDLIVLFWNAFNEIALTKSAALELFKNCRNILQPEGSILLNIDNPANFDPEKMDFDQIVTKHDYRYELDWETKKFNRHTNTTISTEDIKIFNDISGELIQRNVAEITQRWWRLTEIQELAKQSELSVTELSFPENEEYYLNLKKL